ncbi:MAG: cytochrome P450 [Mesorhizobium sp.]|nr:MAG: cytochrome P450 [Mesorhizobium sp.]
MPVPYANELHWPNGLTPFDGWSREIQADPFRHYAWMRENAPLLKAASADGDVWFVSRYADVVKALKSAKAFSSVLADPEKMPFMLFLDPPLHDRLRHVVAAWFTPTQVARYEGLVEGLAEQAMEGVAGSESFDFVERFAAQVSIGTITRFLGTEVNDYAKLRHWTDQFASYNGRISGRSPGSSNDERDALEFVNFMNARLRDAGQGDGLIDHISNLWREGALSEVHATHFCVNLFNAGHDTTTGLLSNSITHLAENALIYERLREQSDDIPKFIEEMARYKGTLQRVARLTTREVELGGETIPGGTKIRLLLGSANRDSEKFANGDVFDIDRDTDGHVGFGFGVHACLGAWLARLETRVSLSVLLKRTTQISLVGQSARQPYTGGTMANYGARSLQTRIRG